MTYNLEMKIHLPYLVLSLLALFCSPACQSQASSGELPNRVRERVAKIDASLSQLAKSTRELETGTDRGGVITIYKERNRIVRLDVQIGLSNADLNHRFYYFNEDLVFATEKRLVYGYSAVSGALDFERPERTSERAYVVLGEKVFPVNGEKNNSRYALKLIREARYLVRAVQRSDKAINLERMIAE